MAMRKLFISLLAIMFCSVADAQSTAREINAIKRDTAYISAEDTNPSREEAIANAKVKLESMVSEWMRTVYPKGSIDACVARTKEHCSLIESIRGNMIRAFVYVKKSDLIPISPDNGVIVVKVGFKQDTINSPKNVTEQMPQTQKPIENKPTARAIVRSITLTPDEEQMKLITDFYDIEPYVKSLRTSKRLEDFGKYATLPAEGKCHVLVYNKEGKVVSALRRNELGEYINLNTLKEDDVKNYKECGAIWLKIK